LLFVLQYFQVQPIFFSGNYCSSQALVCFQWFCCNVMSETHDKHFVLILIHVSMAKDNFLWGGIRRYHLKWVAAHLLRPRAPYAEMRHLRGMRQCFGGAYTTQPATWFLKKTCLSQLKKRSQAPSPRSLTKGRFWQAMLLDVTSGMSHTFHIINTSWKLDAREVKTELLSDVRRPLGPLDLPTAPSIHHDDPPSTPPSRCRHKIRVPRQQDVWWSTADPSSILLSHQWTPINMIWLAISECISIRWVNSHSESESNQHEITWNYHVLWLNPIKSPFFAGQTP
jgi:hypothetical protein